MAMMTERQAEARRRDERRRARAHRDAIMGLSRLPLATRRALAAMACDEGDAEPPLVGVADGWMVVGPERAVRRLMADGIITRADPIDDGAWIVDIAAWALRQIIGA